MPYKPRLPGIDPDECWQALAVVVIGWTLAIVIGYAVAEVLWWAWPGARV